MLQKHFYTNIQIHFYTNIQIHICTNIDFFKGSGKKFPNRSSTSNWNNNI